MVRERGGSTSVGQLQALMDVVETIMESDDFKGCIFVNVTMEFPLPHEPAHQLASQNKQAIVDFVEEPAAAAGADDPPLLARELCMIIEGAYETRLLTGNRDTIHVARGLTDLIIATRCRISVDRRTQDTH